MKRGWKKINCKGEERKSNWERKKGKREKEADYL